MLGMEKDPVRLSRHRLFQKDVELAHEEQALLSCEPVFASAFS